MKRLLVKSFVPYSVFKFFLVMGLFLGAAYSFILTLLPRVPVGIAGAIGLTAFIGIMASYNRGLCALFYNLFACWFRGVEIKLVEEKELKNIELWSTIRMAFPSFIILGAIGGLLPGVILDILARLNITHPALEFFPDFGTGITAGALIGFIMALLLFLQAVIYNLFAHIYKGYQFTLEPSGKNEYTLKSLKIDSIFRLNLILGVVWGIIAAFIVSLIMSLSPFLSCLKGLSLLNLLIIGAVLGIVCACRSALCAFFYNIFARIVGGIRLELTEI